MIAVIATRSVNMNLKEIYFTLNCLIFLNLPQSTCQYLIKEDFVWGEIGKSYWFGLHKNLLKPNPLQALQMHPAECSTVQQQKSAQSAQCNKIRPLERWYLLVSTGNKRQQRFTSVASCGVSWPSGLAYRTQVLVLAAECGFESRPWHLCPWARHLIIIASLHPGVKWVPVRAELVD